MKPNRFRSRVHLRGRGEGVASHAGIELLHRTGRTTGLDRTLSAELAGLRRPRAQHDPGQVMLDVA